MNRDEKRRKSVAVCISLLYAAVWMLLMFSVTCRGAEDRELPSEGILINFGASDTGLGDEDLAASDNVADRASSSPSAFDATPDEYLTQFSPDAPMVPPDSRFTPTQSRQSQRGANPRESPQTNAPRRADQRALFPGRNSSQASSSQGEAGGAGNQGNLSGMPGGSIGGTAKGNSGINYDLEGRSLMSALPLPTYEIQEEGKVIVDITVNQDGRVTAATFSPRGSTTSNGTLVEAALKAAKETRFNETEIGSSPSQRGTITYTFSLIAN